MAVAVSGGADSMALLLLAQEWAESRNGRAVALTVDHGLRTESAQEALQIKNWCKSRGIAHHILNVEKSDFSIGGSGIQAAAREARYALLTDWCREHHVLHLLTAHHRDDQAETLFFRLGRGSLLEGLACMAQVTTVRGTRLLRPLLGFSKTELQSVLKERGQNWLEDPSNARLDYTRNRIRRHLQPSLAERAAQVTEKLGTIRNHLEYNPAEQLTGAILLYPEGYAIIDAAALRAMPRHYGQRALSQLVMTLSGTSYPPRTEKLARLYEELGQRRSFGGLLFTPRKDRILVHREPKAIQEPLMVAADTPTLWDNRFLVECSALLTVRALGYEALRLLEKQSRVRIPPYANRAVLAAVPSFWNLEELQAVPHIHAMYLTSSSLRCRAAFHPAKALAAPAFSSKNALS